MTLKQDEMCFLHMSPWAFCAFRLASRHVMVGSFQSYRFSLTPQRFQINCIIHVEIKKKKKDACFTLLYVMEEFI